MTININFQRITATTISGGGIFLGQNIALGWDAFTKSNTGISNGNHSPITNTLVIVDDRDVFDATVFDADRPVAKVKADPPGGGPHGDPVLGSRSMIQKDSEGGNNNQLVIKKDGKQVYPGDEESTSEEDEDEESEDDPSGDPVMEEPGDAEFQNGSMKVEKVRSRYDLHAAEEHRNPRKIWFDKKNEQS